ncbi:MAG: ADOP family duplicated permease [Vicinamibacterales bacterium]
MTPRVPRAFAWLLRLFPREFREAFGADMAAVFVDHRRAVRARAGLPGVVWLWIRTVPKIAAAAWRERRARASSSSGPSRATGARLPRLLPTGSDLAVALRGCARRPWFSLVTVTAIALGIGAVATVFSAVNAIVLRPLPGTTDGGRLVGIDRRSPDFSEGASTSVALLEHLRARARSLDGMAGWSRVTITVATGGAGVSVDANIVSRDYFDVLGVRPALGRFFAPAEADSSAQVIVVSHAFWATRLGSDPDAVGRTMTVNQRPYRLIGVAPDEFRGVFTPLAVNAWVPLDAQPHLKPERDLTNATWLWTFGRLRAGTSPDVARAELSALTAAWAATADEPAGVRAYTAIRLTPLTGLPDDARRALLGFGAVLFGAALLVLGIAALNVSSLLASQAIARRREMALRAALGGGRWRLVRLLLAETLLLFTAGAAGGLVAAWGATSALERISVPGDVAISLELSPDVRVIAFAFAVALACGLVFGLGPALRGATADPGALLRASSDRAGARRSRLRRALIVGQVACSLMLLTAAGLFARALARGASIDPGFETARVSVAGFNSESWGYDPARGQAFYAELRRRLELAPGVERVAFGTPVPLAATPSATTATIDREGGEGPMKFRALVVLADDAYPETLGLPLLAGRPFTRTAEGGGLEPVLVNQAFARRAWPGAPAVDREVMLGASRARVVGVVRDAAYTALGDDPAPLVYESIARHWRADQILFTRGEPAATAAAIRDVVRSIDPALPVPAVHTLAAETGVALLPQRVAAMATGLMGLIGLALSAVGLYGVIAFDASRRTREIGVRMALGARRGTVLRLVARDGLMLALAGIVIGLAGAAGVTRVMATWLLGVSPLDVPVFAAAAALLGLVALLASYLPARRAAGTDPLRAIRTE